MLVGGCCAISQDLTQTWDSRELLFSGEWKKNTLPETNLSPFKKAFLKVGFACLAVGKNICKYSQHGGEKWWWIPWVRIHKKSPTQIWETSDHNVHKSFLPMEGTIDQASPFQKDVFEVIKQCSKPWDDIPWNPHWFFWDPYIGFSIELGNIIPYITQPTRVLVTVLLLDFHCQKISPSTPPKQKINSEFTPESYKTPIWKNRLPVPAFFHGLCVTPRSRVLTPVTHL